MRDGSVRSSAGWRTAVLAGCVALLSGLLHPGTSDAGSRLAAQPPALPGSGGFAFLVTDDVGRAALWDPCRPVRWVLRPDGAPEGAERVVHDAVAVVARATGLRFVHAGTTDEAPVQGRAQRQPDRYGSGPAPVLVAWSDADETPELAGPQVGLGVASWAGDRLVSGQVVLDAADLVAPDGALSPLAEATVLHELAHVVGLGHVDDPEQLLHATVSARAGFSDGDLRGLRAAGSGSCS